MKRISLYFLVALIAFFAGVLASPAKQYDLIVSQTPEIPIPDLQSRCPPGAFTVKRQPTASLHLVILEANCNGSSWNARLTLQNLGPKAVRAYEIANIEHYEYKIGGESSQGVITDAGVVLAPGEIKILDFSAGFQNGLSYGRPTGSIQSNVFWIKDVEYSDGTSWHQTRPAFGADSPVSGP